MRDQRHRRMALLVAVAAVALAGVILIGRGTGGAGHAAPPSTSGTTPSTSARPPGPPSSTTTSTPPRGPGAVGEVDLAMTRGARQFSTVVFYPATRTGSDAPPLRGSRPYPLIVFSPGFDIDPAVYTPLLAGWSAAGYVVAEPYYPSTAPGAPGGVNESDIVQHPADLRAVIDRLLTLDSAPGVLDGLVDPDRIGVAGHSDGGDVTDAVVADSCCRDPRIKAAEVLSGAELTSFGGSYGSVGLPLLAVQGDADDINAPSCSEQIYDGAGGARYYLDLHGAGHLPPYTLAPGGVVYRQAVTRVTLLFWRAYLGGDRSALGVLAEGGGVGEAGTLTHGAAVATVGTCPGAP